MDSKILNLMSRLTIPIVLLLSLLFYYVGTKGALFGEDVGATYYLVHPISLTIFLLSIYLIYVDVSEWKKLLKEEGEEVFIDKETLTKIMKGIITFIICVFGYIYSMKFISFIPATILYLCITFIVFKVRKVLHIILLPIILTGLLYIAFKMLLNVPLP